MCTLTWQVLDGGGYDLFFNRDELHTRGAERPPRMESIDGVAFAAPRDSDRDGTWIMVNAHGLTVALLNDYACRWRPPANEAASRGALVMACAAVSAQPEVAKVVGRAALDRTGAFKLVALDAGGAALRLHWDGRILREEKHETLSFETSSSFETEAVCAARRRQFEDLTAGELEAGTETLRVFHWSHDERNGAASVLMRRPDARTRSVTGVNVRASHVAMEYVAVGECGGETGRAGVSVRFSRL